MPVTLPAPPSGPAMNMQAFGASLQQGAHIYVMIGSKPVGYITNISDSESYGTQGFYALSSIMPQELQSLQWSGSCTIAGGRVYNASWQSAFMYPGSAILQQGLINIAKYNKVTKALDKVYVGCVPTTYSSTNAANAYALQNGTWMYQNLYVPGFGLTSPVANNNISATQATGLSGIPGVQGIPT